VTSTPGGGRVQSTDARPDGDHEIVALVPAAEMTRYAVDLRAITGGRGRFTATHDHYDLLPANLLGQVTTSV
jgi:elongation factor G